MFLDKARLLSDEVYKVNSSLAIIKYNDRYAVYTNNGNKLDFKYTGHCILSEEIVMLEDSDKTLYMINAKGECVYSIAKSQYNSKYYSIKDTEIMRILAEHITLDGITEAEKYDYKSTIQVSRDTDYTKLESENFKSLVANFGWNRDVSLIYNKITKKNITLRSGKWEIKQSGKNSLLIHNDAWYNDWLLNSNGDNILKIDDSTKLINKDLDLWYTNSSELLRVIDGQANFIFNVSNGDVIENGETFIQYKKSYGNESVGLRIYDKASIANNYGEIIGSDMEVVVLTAKDDFIGYNRKSKEVRIYNKSTSHFTSVPDIDKVLLNVNTGSIIVIDNKNRMYIYRGYKVESISKNEVDKSKYIEIISPKE